eukprot:TRINITY_DN28381_c0_g3_i1.p1 TRINITY_DN28381_c0_g3~~TRINITY_DN28381_c0_g3_i1.p1  ORF type:complete len:642 (+),score=110.34 TRINITY_DN28381_c0_g3_i1:69-1994(+)
MFDAPPGRGGAWPQALMTDGYAAPSAGGGRRRRALLASGATLAATAAIAPALLSSDLLASRCWSVPGSTGPADYASPAGRPGSGRLRRVAASGVLEQQLSARQQQRCGNEEHVAGGLSFAGSATVGAALASTGIAVAAMHRANVRSRRSSEALLSLVPAASRGSTRVARCSKELEELRTMHALPFRERLRAAAPCGDDLDQRIAAIALPSVLNFLIFPLVGAVDTYWVGRMGSALALAGQGAANQVFSTVFWFISFLPSVTAPLVARAWAAGDKEAVRRQICEALFVAVCLGVVGNAILLLFSERVLSLVLTADAPARAFALPYLRIRAMSFVPSLIGTVGFASFRGMKRPGVPLCVSAVSNIVNISLDPVLIFTGGMGVAGAALATVVSDVIACLTYLVLLAKNKLGSILQILSPPPWSRLAPLIRSGLIVQARSFALNAAFILATRQAQALDASGVQAAAYSISINFWQLGGVMLFALQACAAVIIPLELGKPGATTDSVRAATDRLLCIGLLAGVTLGGVQLLCLPILSAFSPLPSVREAAFVPAVIGAIMQVVNGIVFVGEGVMQGHKRFGALAAQTAVAAVVMIIAMRITQPLGLVGIWLSIGAFNIINLFGVLRQHFRVMERAKHGVVEKETVEK